MCHLSFQTGGTGASGVSVGAVHRDRRYIKAAARITGLAKGTPTAICWKHGTHVSQCPPHRNGTPSKWVAGHTIDGSTNWTPWYHVSLQPPPGDWLAPQCSASNSSDGAAYGNRRREPSSGWA